MPLLANPRHDAFAECGLDIRGRNIKRVDGRADVIARIAELERDAAWGGSGNLKPVIDELMRLAEVAGELGSAAGMTAAGGLLCEAARLKGLLEGQSPHADAADPPRRVRLSNDEWLAKFAPPQ